MLSRVLGALIVGLLISNALSRWELSRAREELAHIKASAQVETERLKQQIGQAEERAQSLETWVRQPNEGRADFEGGACRP